MGTQKAIVFGRPYGMPKPSLGEVLYRSARDGSIESAADVEAVIQRDGYDLQSSVPLNEIGYELLGGGDVAQAIAVFEVNASRFPDDPNCFDSLAEAVLASGDRDRAIALYRRALEVEPGFESSRRMLEQLTAGR